MRYKGNNPQFRTTNCRKFLDEKNNPKVQPPIGSVRTILELWELGGIEAVKFYLNECEIHENTWIAKIKKLIDEKQILSAQAEIDLVYYNVNLSRNQK